MACLVFLCAGACMGGGSYADGYLTVEAAKRLLVALGLAIANSEAPRPDADAFAEMEA